VEILFEKGKIKYNATLKARKDGKYI